MTAFVPDQTLTAAELNAAFAAVTPPSATLLGGTGSAFTSVAISTQFTINGGTLDLGNVAASSLFGNSGSVSATPSALAVGSGLSLSAAGTLSATGSGGTVTQVVAGQGLNGGTITASGTISLETLAASSLFGNSATAAGTMSAVAIGSGLSLATTGTLSGSVSAAGIGAVINSGTVEVNNVATLTGTASGTLTISAGSGTSDIVVNMPASGGTVTLAAAPSFKRQRYEIDIVQGATAGSVVLNSGFIFGTSGGPAGYTATATASAVDRLMTFSPDGTKLAVLAIAQGFTL